MSAPPTVFRIAGLTGHRKHASDVLLGFAASCGGDGEGSSPIRACGDLIFFPGDAQNYHELMQRGNCARFREYNLDTITEMLAERYKGQNVWTIRPCRYQEGVFACYNGFVPDLDDLGRPLADYTPSLSAWPHLAALMAKCHASVASMTAPPRPVPSEHTMFSPKRHVVPPTSTPVTIIGFSKGTVVLNQLLLELPLLQSSPRSKLIDSIDALVNRVCCVHFLDGIGHTRLVPASLLPPSALQGPLVTPPSVSPLSSSFLKASETPKDLDSVSDVPWYHTLPVVVTPIPTVDSTSSTIAVTTLSLPLLPHRCVFMIHGTPYQWCDSDAERAVRKPQALWLHSQLEEQGFTSHILEYYKGDERDSDSIVKHHFKLLFDFKLRPDSA